MENSDLFNAGEKEREQAIRALLRGKTPVTEVRKRPARGGAEVNYVNTYYMTRQLALVTGFRWSSEYLEDRARPNWENPVEVGVKVKITIWDNQGNSYSHTSWGGKEVARYKTGEIISLFDDLKAATSDAIKKAISYFGIASDVYGGKELEYFDTDKELPSSNNENYQAFGKFLSQNHISVSKALAILKVDKLSDITDYSKAAKEVSDAVLLSKMQQ